VPKVDGPPAREAALEVFRQLQRGEVDRKRLGEEFDWFLTPEKVKGAAGRLQPLKEPAKVEVESLAERGGMEVATVRFTFPSLVLQGSMYRTPDGKIQQFLITRE
jgi:hypothetical protein